MSAFFELSRQTEAILQDSAALSDKLGFATSAQVIREQLDAFHQKELTIVVVGEARRGKSSLLNALLNEKTPLFPMDVNVCTNVVTIVRYGASERIEAYLESPEEKTGCRIERISREQIPDYVSEKGNPNNYKQVKLLYACIPNDLLRDGAVFVDTPGVGGLNIAHTETACSFLPNADVLLFVSDADAGLTESELSFLKRSFQYCKNILFPLTKKDLNVHYTAILEDNREKISQALNIPAEEVSIIPVSSAAKLRYLRTGSATMRTNSNYDALESAIWRSIARRKGEVLLLPFLAEAKRELLRELDSVVSQEQTLGAGQNITQEWMDELKRKTADLEALQENGADWRSQLSLFFSLLQNDTSSAQRQIGSNARTLVQTKARALESQICQEGNYTQLVCDINDLIRLGILSIRGDIAQRVADKSEELQQQLQFSLQVNQDILNGLGFVPGQTAIVFPKKKALDTAIKTGRTIGWNSMGGGTIGTVLGGLIGLCVGGPAGVVLGAEIGGGVGGLVGGARGCVDGLKRHDQVDINVVIQALNQYIMDAMAGVSTNTSNTFAALSSALNRSFESQLRRQAKRLREDTERLQKNIQMAANELPQKRIALKEGNAQLRAQLKRYEALEAAVGQLDQPEPSAAAPAETEELSYDFL